MLSGSTGQEISYICSLSTNQLVSAGGMLPAYLGPRKLGQDDVCAVTCVAASAGDEAEVARTNSICSDGAYVTNQGRASGKKKIDEITKNSL